MHIYSIRIQGKKEGREERDGREERGGKEDRGGREEREERDGREEKRMEGRKWDGSEGMGRNE